MDALGEEIRLIILDRKQRVEIVLDCDLYNVSNSSENSSMKLKFMSIDLVQGAKHLESSIDSLMPSSCKSLGSIRECVMASRCYSILFAITIATICNVKLTLIQLKDER